LDKQPKGNSFVNEEQRNNDRYASEVMDAYLAEINYVDTHHSSMSWYLDLKASNYVTRNFLEFLSLSSTIVYPQDRQKIIILAWILRKSEIIGGLCHW
jgi:hypothetical protein